MPPPMPARPPPSRRSARPPRGSSGISQRMWKAVAALLLTAAAGAQTRDFSRDRAAAGRDKMAEYVAFVRLAAEPCAGLIAVPENWTVEAKLLSGVVVPPL